MQSKRMLIYWGRMQWNFTDRWITGIAGWKSFPRSTTCVCNFNFVCFHLSWKKLEKLQQVVNKQTVTQIKGAVNLFYGVGGNKGVQHFPGGNCNACPRLQKSCITLLFLWIYGAPRKQFRAQSSLTVKAHVTLSWKLLFQKMKFSHFVTRIIFMSGYFYGAVILCSLLFTD